MFGQQQADLLVVRREIRELLQRPEGVLQLARLRHPLGIFEEIPLCFRDESSVHHELRELEIDRRTARCVAQDLVAQRYRVVGEAVLRVAVDCLLVRHDAGGDVANLHVEIAEPVVDPKLGVDVARRLQLLDDPLVLIDRLVPLALDLELPGLVFRSFDVQGEPRPADR